MDYQVAVTFEDESAREGRLTTEHSASSYGRPILVIDARPHSVADAVGGDVIALAWGSEHDCGGTRAQIKSALAAWGIGATTIQEDEEFDGGRRWWWIELRESYVELAVAAAILPVSRQRIEQLCNDGKVRRRLHGQRACWLYHTGDLLAHRATAKPGRPRKDAG